ncbi:MAG TPA: tRNA (guanosine(37)-N1)-methyltransferase TrmD [Candidatus Paceibacterota bacterium]|nr:tRNA (guanosine(37)-N1)-methyltransferase TrmD [Candidatus Paceibacterota bacterium]
MTHFHIITLFPEAIAAYFESSILGRAQDDKKIAVSYYNPRDFVADTAKGATRGKHWERVDRRPYGGGPGMVLAPEPVLKAAEKAIGRKKDVTVLFFSPSGAQFDAGMAKELARAKHVVLLCGRYEGIDARVPKILKAKAVSVGPYVLTGGELAAGIVIDAAARYVNGVLGKNESREDERTASPDVYTRPEILTWKGKRHRVPPVLLSGHHALLEEWRGGRLETAKKNASKRASVKRTSRPQDGA